MHWRFCKYKAHFKCIIRLYLKNIQNTCVFFSWVKCFLGFVVLTYDWFSPKPILMIYIVNCIYDISEVISFKKTACQPLVLIVIIIIITTRTINVVWFWLMSKRRSFNSNLIKKFFSQKQIKRLIRINAVLVCHEIICIIGQNIRSYKLLLPSSNKFKYICQQQIKYYYQDK